MANKSSEEWPKPQDCGDVFDEEGKASTKVDDCSNYPPELEAGLIPDAQDDAQEKANFRCPNRCPAERQQWVSNRKTCIDNTLTVYVVGRFKCKEQ